MSKLIKLTRRERKKLLALSSDYDNLISEQMYDVVNGCADQLNHFGSESLVSVDENDLADYSISEIGRWARVAQCAYLGIWPWGKAELKKMLAMPSPYEQHEQQKAA